MSIKNLYGIIGQPLSHSLSPAMHNAAFKALQMDAEYHLFPLKESELEAFFASLKKKDNRIRGFNVTVPYKEVVLKYMDLLSPFAQKVKAINTVTVAADGRLEGFNTDGPGFLTHLTELKIKTQHQRISLLGAGGTARSILAVLCLLPERPETILIYNRHYEKALELIRDLGLRMDASCLEAVKSVDSLNVELADLLINTTSVGLKAEDPCLIKEESFHSNLWVYDVIYNPFETKLLALAKSKGARTVNGLGMLFYQGVLAFQHWTKVQLDIDVKTLMWESLAESLEKKNDA